MCTRNQYLLFYKTNTSRQESSNIIIVNDLSTSMFINSYVMKSPPENHWENFRVKLYYKQNRLNRLLQNVISQTAEYAFLSASHATLSNRDQILDCRISLDKHQKGKKNLVIFFLIIMKWNHIKQQEKLKKHYKHIEVEKMAKERERLMD